MIPLQTGETEFDMHLIEFMSAPHASGPCVGPHVSSAIEEVSGSI